MLVYSILEHKSKHIGVFDDKKGKNVEIKCRLQSIFFNPDDDCPRTWCFSNSAVNVTFMLFIVPLLFVKMRKKNDITY